MDDVIDISELRGYGLQPGEEELPDLVDERQSGNQHRHDTRDVILYSTIIFLCLHAFFANFVA